MAKHSYEFKLKVVHYYLSGAGGGYKKTAHHFGIDHSLIRQWVAVYQCFGSKALQSILKRSYTVDFKEQVVLSVKNDGLSLRQAALKFGPLHHSMVLKWLKLYDAGGRNALQPKTSGCNSSMKIKPLKTTKADDQKTQKELLNELVYLRAEVAYLKKYNALVQEKATQRIKLESSQD